MKAGPELDALVAEKVMGWVRTQESWYDEEGVDATVLESPTGAMVQAHGWGKDCDYSEFGDVLPRFSTDIAAAFELLRRYRNSNYVHVEILASPSEAFWCFRVRTDAGGPVIATAEESTAPLAICAVILKALGVEVPA